MIEECEDLMPQQLFAKSNWFPRFIIIRREKGSTKEGENSEEWMGFVKQMKRHLDRKSAKIQEYINHSTDSTKRELELMKKEQKDAQKDTSDKIDEIKYILNTVFKYEVARIEEREAAAKAWFGDE